jgi:hypothetical protein
MKKVLLCLIVGLLMLSVSAYAAEQAANVKTGVFKGYLSDVACGKAGKDPAGVDLTATPEKHTVKCMLMPSCVQSGYGIFILNKKTNKYVFYAFDAQGSELAKKDVLDKTQKAEGIYIQVKGSLDKDKNILTVENIVAKDAPEKK